MVGVIAGLRNIFQIGQRFQQRSGKLRALAHRNDHARVLERFSNDGFGRKFFRQDLNLKRLSQALDRFSGLEGALVVVEDRNFHRMTAMPAISIK